MYSVLNVESEAKIYIAFQFGRMGIPNTLYCTLVHQYTIQALIANIRQVSHVVVALPVQCTEKVLLGVLHML